MMEVSTRFVVRRQGVTVVILDPGPWDTSIPSRGTPRTPAARNNVKLVAEILEPIDVLVTRSARRRHSSEGHHQYQDDSSRTTSRSAGSTTPRDHPGFGPDHVRSFDRQFPPTGSFRACRPVLSCMIPYPRTAAPARELNIVREMHLAVVYSKRFYG